MNLNWTISFNESQLNNQFQFQILIFFCSFKETESGNDNTLKNITQVNEAGVQNYSNRNSLLPKSTIFCWSLINVVIFSFCLPNPVHFRDSSSSGKPDCFPDVPSRFLNCPENSEETKVVGVGDGILRSAAQMGPYRSPPLSMSYGTEKPQPKTYKRETGLNKEAASLSIWRPGIHK